MFNIADNRLTAILGVDVSHRDGLFASVSVFPQRLDLRCIGAASLLYPL